MPLTYRQAMSIIRKNGYRDKRGRRIKNVQSYARGMVRRSRFNGSRRFNNRRSFRRY